MRFRRLIGRTLMPLALGACAAVRSASGQAPASSPPATASPENSYGDSEGGFSLEHALTPRPPHWISEDLYLNLWGWGSYLNVDPAGGRSNGDGQLSLDLTKSFNGRVALTGEMSLLAANDHWRGDLEQAFASFLISEDAQTVLTLGKFHAGMGVEGRDFWDRQTGTTSLLFSAQPQDLVGAMFTLPLGQTGLSLKPFIATQFQGHLNIRTAPSGGVIAEYHPAPEITFSLTNWLGPGFVAADQDPEDPSGQEYAWAAPNETYAPADGDSSAYGAAGAIDNWLGPQIQASPGGLLYFVDGFVRWQPRPDLTLAAEALSGTTRATTYPAGWQGCLVLASYNLTDRWRVFGRWSFLNDPAGIITGTDQHRQEASAGVGYTLTRNIELRGEYRRDWSSAAADTHTISLHVSFGF